MVLLPMLWDFFVDAIVEQMKFLCNFMFVLEQVLKEDFRGTRQFEVLINLWF